MQVSSACGQDSFRREADDLRRRPSPAGKAVGITLTAHIGKNGESFAMVTLTERAQRWLIDRLFSE